MDHLWIESLVGNSFFLLTISVKVESTMHLTPQRLQQSCHSGGTAVVLSAGNVCNCVNVKKDAAEMEHESAFFWVKNVKKAQKFELRVKKSVQLLNFYSFISPYFVKIMYKMHITNNFLSLKYNLS